MSNEKRTALKIAARPCKHAKPNSLFHGFRVPRSGMTTDTNFFPKSGHLKLYFRVRNLNKTEIPITYWHAICQFGQTGMSFWNELSLLLMIDL